MKIPKCEHGFNLIELMVVVAVIVFLVMLAIPNVMRFLAKAKRTEVYVNLGSMYTAQKAYSLEHGKYSAILIGNDGVGWQPEGYSGGGSKERFYYTYGFGDGAEGQNYFTGKLNTPHTLLIGTMAGNDSFVAGAAGYVNGSKADVLTVNDVHDVVIVQDGI